MSNNTRIDTDDLGLYVNFPISDVIGLAPADAEKAAEVLLLAAKLLRDRQPLPYELADYLADAFEASMNKTPELRVKHLAFELNLHAKNKRPSKIQWIDAYRIMVANGDLSRSKQINLISKKYHVSESHARRQLTIAEKAVIESERISHQEVNEKTP